MTAKVTQTRMSRRLEDYFDMIRLTGDVGEALRGTGRDYASWRRTLTREGYAEAVTELEEWQRQDSERLRYALGRQWQRERTDNAWG